MPYDPPLTPRTRRAASVWHWTGAERPPFADRPADGQESVWDYPRPPAVLPVRSEVVVKLGETLVARSRRALRVLETASPPTVYIPGGDVVAAVLRACPGSSACEWKGVARYHTVVAEGRTERAVGWSYPTPHPEYASLAGHVSFYPGRLACWLDGERVRPQPGRFYGGWVTDAIAGPVKGEPGSSGW